MSEQIVVQKQLVSYFIVGDKQARSTLLFLHGWQSQKEVWNIVVSQLLNFRVVCLDLPGFGQSPASKEPWAVGDYANLVKSFIEKLELKNVVLVGHSFGGRVAIKIGSQNLGSISKILLVDAAGFTYTGAKKTFVNFLAKIVKPFFRPRFMHALRRRIYKAIDSEDYLTAGSLRDTYIKVISEDLSEDMKRIKVPALIVTGENDQDTPVEFGRRMHSLIHNSVFKIIPKAGHFSFIDQPGEFIKILKEFASSTE